jgi:hypothetical protein
MLATWNDGRLEQRNAGNKAFLHGLEFIIPVFHYSICERSELEFLEEKQDERE